MFWAVSWTAPLTAQLVYTESFRNSEASGWVYITGNTNPGPRLTAGATPFGTPPYGSGDDPEVGGVQIDTEGFGWLRMASTVPSQANSAFLNLALPAAGTRVQFEFNIAFWGDQGSAEGGDGLAVTLSNANVAYNAGAFGGSLGYAQKTGIDGMAGGYMGVGLDVFGNYTNPTEGRIGGPGFNENEVTLRGPGDGTSGYLYVGGTADAPGGMDSLISGPNNQLDFPSYTARPDQDATDWRRVRVLLDENNRVSAWIEFGFGAGYQLLFENLDLTAFGTRPEEFRIGFSSGTGGANQVYEVRDLRVEITGGANSFYWDDGANTTAWGTGLNWDKDTVPTVGASVFFTDAFSGIENPESVVLGANRTVGSVYFSGQNSYTLSGNTLIFDAPGSVPTSRIFVLNSPTGNADHTIASAVRADNNLEVNHLTATALNFTGAVNLNSNALQVETAGGGVSTFSGVVSGTGSTITKLGDGTLVLSGANTYTGTTTIQNGILEARNNSALGGTGAGTTVQSGGTLALTNNITINTEALSLSGIGEAGRGALLNISGNNTYNGAITLAGASRIAAEAGTLTLGGSATITGGGNALTFQTASASTIQANSVISGSGTSLTKNGEGTLILNAANTHTGLTTVNAGVLRVTNDNALGTTAAATVVNSGATLELAGGRAIPDAETLTISGTGVAGKAALWSDSGSNLWNGDIAVTGGSASFGAAAGATLRLNGVISGSGQDVIITGPGTTIFEDPMSYTGRTLIQQGTLQFADGANRIADASDVTVSSGATLNMNSLSDTIGSLAGGGNVQLGTATLTTGATNLSTTYSGVISGTGNVVKTGSGTMTIGGSNTFTGDLIINQGTIRVTAANAFANSMDLVMNGGTYSIAGVADTLGAFDLNASSSFNYEGTSGGLITFGSVAASPTGTFTVDNWIGNALTTTPASTTTGFFVTGGSITADMTTLASNTTFTGWGSGSGWKTVSGGFELVPILTGAFRWDRDSGTWSNAVGNNWVGDTAPPNATAGTVVYFGNDEDPAAGVQNPASAKNITLDGNRTVGTMILDGTNGRAYNFTASGGNRTLTFDQTGTGSTFLTVGGTEAHVIGSTNPNNTRVNVALSDNLLIQNNSSAATGLTFGTSGGAHTFALGGNTLTVTGTSRTVIHSQITDSGSLVKNGSGILEMTDTNNTFSGGVTLNEGTLQIGSNAALGTGTLTINGGTLQATGGARTVDERTNINGSFTFSGSNTLTLNRSGVSTVGAGTHTITVNDVTGSSASDLIFDASHDLTGSGGLVKDGAGTLELRGNDSDFSGGLTVNSGTVTTGAAFDGGITIGADVTEQNYLGSGTVTVNSGGTLTTTQNVSTGSTGFDFTIASGGVLTNAGTATITNARPTEFDADLFLGGTINSSGTTQFVDWNDLEVTAAASINVSGGTTTIGLTDDFNNASPNSNALAINVTGGVLNVNLANSEGSSAFVLGTDDTLTVNGGSMTINAGAAASRVDLNGRLNLYNGSTLTVSQGTTLLDSTTVFDGGTGAVKGTLVLQGSLVVDNPLVANSPNITFNSNANRSITAETGVRSLTDVGTLTKTGSGTLTIDASINNIEAQTIVITQGTLLNGTSNQISNDTNMVLGGGTYDTNGFDEILGTLTLTANSTIDLNNSGGGGDSVLRFADSSAMAWTGGTGLEITGWTGLLSGGGTDQVYFGTDAGGLTTSQLSQITFINPVGLAPGNYAAVILSTGEIVPVPEPGVYAAAALLLAWLGWRERWRWLGAKR